MNPSALTETTTAPSTPTLDRVAPPARSRKTTTALAMLPPLLLLLMLSLVSGRVSAVIDQVGKIVEIRVVGNTSISFDSLRKYIESREGRDVDKKLIEADRNRLVKSELFSDVRTFIEADKKRNGYVVIYQVVERQVLRAVEFRGAKQIKVKDLEERSGLKKGARADNVKVMLALEGIKQLYQEKGFEFAEIKIVEGSKPGQTRAIFDIFEGPKCKITKIDFEGNSLVDSRMLATKVRSGKHFLLLGGIYHAEDVEEDVQKLKEYYLGLGYFRVNVEPVKRTGATPGEYHLTFVIWEGPQFQVRNISFEGNKLIKTETLRSGLVMHSGKPFSDALREADRKLLEERYGEIGCIDAKIEAEKKYPDPRSNIIDIVYNIEEGDPYILGHFKIQGNHHTREDVLRREAEMAGLVPGEPLNMTRVKKYEKRIHSLQYFNTNPENGRLIEIKLVNRRPHDQPYGEVPLLDVQSLNEVVRTRMQGPSDPPSKPVATSARPATKPGKPSLIVYVEKPEKKVDDDQKKPVTVVDLNASAPRRPKVEPATGDLPMLGTEVRSIARLQDPAGPPVDPPASPPPADPFPPADNQAPGVKLPPVVAPTPRAPGPGFEGSGGIFDPPPELPPIEVPPAQVGPQAGPRPAPGGTRTPPLGENEPPGFPSNPGNNMVDPGPDRQEPFTNRSFVDLVTQVDEASTGRLGLSVGVNSYQGLMGSFVIHERNFDIFNIPKNWDELFSGNAFRGRGQDFRIELSPGLYVNRALASFTDPYAFGLPIGFNAQAYAFNRVYPDFTDGRAGGRFSLGRQFGTSIYADVAVRAEDVSFSGFKYPAPSAYLAAEGHTQLYTIRPSFRYDNRNDAFSPNKGSYVEAAFEQGFGSFSYPKFTVEARQYLTVGSRPDGTGKRFFTFRSFFGATGRDTPVYERFFAGDFRSLRGFAYRGVGPRELGVNVGGVMSALGSVEYQFSWTASDKLQQVFFVDYGTVEPNYTITSIRAAVGTGLRIYLPQQMFGNLPLAFDFAVPVLHAEGDRLRLFTFFIGTFF